MKILSTLNRTLLNDRNKRKNSIVNRVPYMFHLFLRYTTLEKLLNLIATNLQRKKTTRVLGKPYYYVLDVTNMCNLHCPICPTGLGIIGRQQGIMDLDSFYTIIDKISQYAYILEVGDWGEPFLHPDIFDMITYAHNHYIAVKINSNLNHFSREMAESAIASSLDYIMISVDGVTQESYERYHVGGNLSEVFNNIKLLVEARERQDDFFPFIFIRMLVHRYNEHQIGRMKGIAKNLGVDGLSLGPLFVNTNNPQQVEEWLPKNGTLSCYDYSADEIKNTWNCSELWDTMVINWDGGVSPCCWVHRKENDLGDILNASLAELWNNEAYKSSRRALMPYVGPGQKRTICTICQGRPMYLKY